MLLTSSLELERKFIAIYFETTCAPAIVLRLHLYLNNKDMSNQMLLSQISLPQRILPVTTSTLSNPDNWILSKQQTEHAQAAQTECTRLDIHHCETSFPLEVSKRH